MRGEVREGGGEEGGSLVKMEVGWEKQVREKETEEEGERFLCDALPGQALELYR